MNWLAVLLGVPGVVAFELACAAWSALCDVALDVAGRLGSG